MSLFFKNRTGQTTVDQNIIKDLKLTHVNDMSELYEHEVENIAAGIAWTLTTSKSHTDHNVWLEIHKHMLSDVWKFAGKIRTTELANPEFRKPFEVRPSLLALEHDLKAWLEFKSYPPTEMLAIFHEKLLTIHPFKDGNGRWSRVVTEFVARKENFTVPNWRGPHTDDDKRRASYIAAVKKARHNLDYSDLITTMFP